MSASFRIKENHVLVVATVVLALVAAPTSFLLSVWIPYRRESRIVGKIEELGGQVHVRPGGPDWLRSIAGDDKMHVFDRIDSVALYDEAATSGTLLGDLAQLTALRTLYFTWSEISDDELGSISGIKRLSELTLSETHITDAGMRHIAKLTCLRALYLDKTRISDAGLAQISGLTDLEELVVSGIDVSDDGMSHLSARTRLRALFLGGTRVSDKGLLHLRGLKNLTQLDLNHTLIDDAGLATLRGLENLERLDLTGTRVTTNGAESIKNVFSRCEVRY